MTQPVQLKLWPDESGRIQLQCPHCGWKFNALPQLQQNQDELEHAVLEHPRVRTLPSRTRAFFEAALPALLYADEAVGVTQIADEAAYSPSGTHKQLQHLVRHQVIRKERIRKYSRYRLVIPNGAA